MDDELEPKHAVLECTLLQDLVYQPNTLEWQKVMNKIFEKQEPEIDLWSGKKSR